MHIHSSSVAVPHPASWGGDGGRDSFLAFLSHEKGFAPLCTSMHFSPCHACHAFTLIHVWRVLLLRSLSSAQEFFERHCGPSARTLERAAPLLSVGLRIRLRLVDKGRPQYYSVPVPVTFTMPFVLYQRTYTFSYTVSTNHKSRLRGPHCRCAGQRKTPSSHGRKQHVQKSVVLYPAYYTHSVIQCRPITRAGCAVGASPPPTPRQGDEATHAYLVLRGEAVQLEHIMLTLGCKRLGSTS